MFFSALQGELLRTHFERWCLSQRQTKCGGINSAADKWFAQGHSIKTGSGSPDAPLPVWHFVHSVLVLCCFWLRNKFTEKYSRTEYHQWMIGVSTWCLFTRVVITEELILKVLCSIETGWVPLTPFLFSLFCYWEVVAYLHRMGDSLQQCLM